MAGYSVLDLHVHVHVQCKMVGTLPNITILFCVAVDRGGSGCVDGGSTGVDIAYRLKTPPTQHQWKISSDREVDGQLVSWSVDLSEEAV